MPKRYNAQYDVLMQSLVSNVYGLLQRAAFHQLFVTYRDVAPLLLGYSPDKATDAQTDVLWHVLYLTMQIDRKQGKAPLAALFISKVGNKPRAPFYDQYAELYGTTLNHESWKQLVQNIYADHNVSVLTPAMAE